MGQNLKARLSRIRDTGRNNAAPAEKGFAPSAGEDSGFLLSPPEDNFGQSSWRGWTQAGHKTLRRVLCRELNSKPPSVFSAPLALIVPDLVRAGKIPLPEELLFFDLETTGLSGGAGTVAFLAAFGRIVSPSDGGRLPGRARLEITQYLLLDYPGENDFVEHTVKEFAARLPPVVVSYNGKSFDSQILKTRCLMNGIMPPEYLHADLLHPARRLWKRMLPDCSQASIETSVLGLDRSGDVPGSLAPEIWFSFLRTGENRELLSICDHNLRDIQGLAALFLALEEIAAEPFKTGRVYGIDEEALALAWNEGLRKNPSRFGNGEKESGELLLEKAALRRCPRAAFVFALSLQKKGRHSEARKLLLETAENETTGTASGAVVSPGSLRAAAFKALAVDAEWRLEDLPLALRFTDSAFALPEITAGFRKELEKRRQRLLEKAGRSGLSVKVSGIPQS